MPSCVPAAGDSANIKRKVIFYIRLLYHNMIKNAMKKGLIEHSP